MGREGQKYLSRKHLRAQLQQLELGFSDNMSGIQRVIHSILVDAAIRGWRHGMDMSLPSGAMIDWEIIERVKLVWIGAVLPPIDSLLVRLRELRRKGCVGMEKLDSGEAVYFPVTNEFIDETETK